MGKNYLLPVALIAIVLGLLYYLLAPEQQAPAPTVVAQTPAPSAAPALSSRDAETVERYPIVAETPPGETSAPINLDDDTAYRDGLLQLLGIEALANFYPDRMIRRFVATIDNLPREEAPAKMMPVKPVGGPFLVDRNTDSMTVDPANAQRYLRYLNIMAAVDARRLVDFYVGHYPVFQQAYRELGYPRGHFNDRLIDAIDNLLATPDVTPPLAVVQPKVLYKFADPALEKRSAGQKIMLRMGADNMVRAKVLLSAIRGELLQRSLTN